MPDYTGPIPVPSPETRPFWDAAKRHELRLPRCRACGALHYYPRGACPTCLSGDLAWEQVSGKATLHTFTIVHRGQKGFPVPTPYVLAVVALAEGPRMMTTLVDVDPARVKIGMPVEVVFRDVSDTIALPLFRPAGAS
ncbi:MAG: Zn-ribbon domain-containing OB-fold protein [Candidatus Binatia bacterium]